MDTDFKIKFDGEQHQIDANTLVSNLIHVSSIIQEINRGLDSDKKIDIKIKALEKGSFLIHIELVETIIETFKNLLTRENAETAAYIISIFVGLIELKAFAKGKELKKEDLKENKIKIENENGDVIYIENLVYNIYENSPIVKDALSQGFETIENDNSITGYEITDKNENTLIRIDRKDFEYMSLKSEKVLNNEKIIIQSAKLNILKLSFDIKLNWEFYFKGNKIIAKINDPNFEKLINTGESFSKGDVLEVEMEIKQKFDTTVNTFINKSYKINRILKHIKRGEQQELKLN